MAETLTILPASQWVFGPLFSTEEKPPPMAVATAANNPHISLILFIDLALSRDGKRLRRPSQQETHAS
jgi:hypothetical protein